MKRKSKIAEEKKILTVDSDEILFDDLWQVAYDNRMVSCFWDGGDWAKRWDLQRKFAYIYYSDVDQSNGYKSNVKSPEIVGRVQSTLQKMSKFNLSFVVRPKKEKYRFAAELNQLILNEKFKDGQFRYRLKDAYADAVTNGSAIIGVDWLKMGRNVKYDVTNPDEMTDEQLKDFQENGIIPKRKAYMVDYDDVALRNYRLENVYLDPSGITFNSGEQRIGYAFVIEFISWDRWETLYCNNKAFKNTRSVIRPKKTDKVLPESGDVNLEGERDNMDSYLAEPYGHDGDYVTIKKMYNYDKDLYMIKANNQFVYKGPIPYNDKKIPLAMLKAYKAPYQPYGIGLPDLLIPIVTQTELLSNSLYDYAMYTANPMFGVASNEYLEISTKYAMADGAPGTLLPMQNPGTSMQPIRYSPMTVDLFRALETLQRDAVVASQQDPSQLGFMKKGATATANIMNKEITEAYVMSMIDNFQEDVEDIAKMVLSRVHQFMTTSEVNEISEDEEVAGDSTMREVPIEGKDININWDDRTVIVKDSPGGMGSIPLKSDIFQIKSTNEKGEEKIEQITPNDFNVSLSVESIEIISRALEKQEAGEMLSQLSAFMVDTTNPGKVAAHPMPLVDASSVLEEVFTKKGWNRKHLLQYSKLNEDSVNRAKAQNLMMWRGDIVIPHPGESREHVSIHTTFLKELMNRLETMNKDLQQAIVEQQMPEAEQKQEFDMLVAAIEAVKEHVIADSMPLAMDTQATVAKADSMTNPQVPMPQGMGQSVTQSGLGGNQSKPEINNPAQSQMEGGPGQIGGIN